MISEIPKDKQLILFDGVCNLCNSSVLYVIKRDKKNKFLFAPLQSDIGDAIIKKFNINTEQTDSILLYNPKKDSLTYKSTAALLVAKNLGFPTCILSVFLILRVFARNWVYNYIAKHRYQWYGRKESCMIPTPELKSKFLE